MNFLKDKKGLVDGAVALLSVLICQYFIKRVVSPFLSVPAGEQSKKIGLIKPKLYGNTFGVPAVWILIMIIVGGRIFGFWGIMLAIPATAVFAYIFETFISDRIDHKNEMKETKKRIEKY